MSRLSASQQKELDAIFERKQMQDQLRLYNSVTTKCFAECVFDFNGRTLQKNEEACVNNCVAKFILSQTRLMQRFSELQTMQQQ